MQKLLNEMMIRVTTHDSKLNDKAHGHHTVQTLNSNLMFIDIGFTTEIPRLSEYEAIENDTKTIQCYTDGSKMNDKVGAGVYIVDNDTPTCEESYHLGTNSTVFQAETFAVGTAAKILLDSGTKNRKIIINCDSQATIMAMSNIKVKSKSTSTAISELNQLAMDNQVLLRWIPAHKGYDGNEKADSLAKKGSDNLDSAQVLLPIPTTSTMERSAAEHKSSEDEGKMENITQHSFQTSMETKVHQINSETWQREYKNSDTIPHGTL